MNCTHPEKRDKGQRYCRECHAAYMREWRKTRKGIAVTQRHNKKLAGSKAVLAKSKVFLAIWHKKIPRPTRFCCFDCGKKAEVYDHRDYSKELTIEPVCRSCNALRGPAKNS